MNVDVLVIGGGMAGLAAATRASQQGASVLVVEKGPGLGGSAQYAGFLWTAPTREVMRRINPGARPELAAAVVDGYDAAIAWVDELGIPMKDFVAVLGYGRGRETDVAALLAACERLVRERNEPGILLRAAPVSLLQDGARIVGATVAEPQGKRDVYADAVILATGGFAGDPDLRAERIHPLARRLPLRANPQSQGDGLRLGLSAGAATALPNAGFYGHLIPSRVAYDSPHEFTDLTFYHSEHGVLLNLEGERFCDETLGDHLSAMHVLEQPEGRALLVTDQRVHDEWMLRPYVEGVETLDKFALAYRRGARCAIAEDLDEFRALPDEWGYDGAAIYAALCRFNDEAPRGASDPGRELDADPLLTPPYYVIEVIPAITFTLEGLSTNVNGHVLDSSGDPIPGLYAAGADAGGTYHRAYAGGLATALVQGLAAASDATR